MSITSKLAVLKDSIIGYWHKFEYDIAGTDKLPKLSDAKTHNNIVVSLTSYGRRVQDNIVYYTIISLMKQTKIPDVIVLWLDDTNWNADNIPDKLKTLRDKHGVQIRFCEDTKSYKKLIPTMKLYPESVIITVDDDIIYSPYLIEELYDSYMKDTSSVHSFNCKQPVLDNDGEIITYGKWQTIKNNTCNISGFPVGYQSVMYPPHSLHTDVFTKTYKELCPMADDIWFWIQAIRKGTKHKNIKPKKVHNYSFDALYQYFHNGSALTHTNRFENANDVQIRNCLSFYDMDNNIIGQ